MCNRIEGMVMLSQIGGSDIIESIGMIFFYRTKSSVKGYRQEKRCSQKAVHPSAVQLRAE